MNRMTNTVKSALCILSVLVTYGCQGEAFRSGEDQGDSSLTQSAQTYLYYNLPKALKQSTCSGDKDNDCLHDSYERKLAWLVAPNYFYDEGEECAGAWYTKNPDAKHYGRRDYVQVRPMGDHVAHWKSSNRAKWVQITYFLLFPHDCNSLSGGHQGDGEHVQFKLFSYNLKRWYLYGGWYHHHGKKHWFNGAYLRARANEIGSAYASIAADEDGHGSWPGRRGNSSHCAGDEDSFCWGTCDCFKGTMRSAYQNRYREYLPAYNNIGGPSPERWQSNVVVVSGNHAYIAKDVGHGKNKEYWTKRTDKYKQFCGWECSRRKSDGSCHNRVHGTTKCSTALSEKVDRSCYRLHGSCSSSPPSSDCPTGQKCCESVPSGCLFCVPIGASCP